jgi:serine/threonine-protein kinase
MAWRSYFLFSEHSLYCVNINGMAVVYKAYDTRLEREVAIKVIRTDLFGKAVIERILVRFEREAKALAKLSHPNIVGVIDYGEHDSAPYLVLVYLPGGTLKERMKGKPMSWQEAVRLLIPIANALDYAHELKVVHRDVKPANILLTAKGQPMLSDFGIAKILEVEDGQTLTGTGMGVGTPEYMAPEQGLGKEVDGRADIYSLGIIFYELVTGHKPYSADTPMAVILKHTTDPLPRPRQFAPNLPDTVERVLLKALAKDPKQRYPNAGAFAAALENLISAGPPRDAANVRNDSEETVDGFVTYTQHVSKTNPQSKKKNANALWIGLGAVVIILAAVLGTWLIRGSGNTASPTAALTTPTQTGTSGLGIGSAMVGDDGMIMVYVPEGKFSMGSDSSNFSNEKPAHQIDLSAFWIDQSEVTIKQYTACVNDKGCTPPEQNSSFTRMNYFDNPEFDDFPVIYVNWDQASAYCAWAGRRLPTEAEWEKAARGTDGRAYPWGDNTPKDTYLNYNQNKDDTTKAGNYKSGKSPYGVYDMAGNVSEWVNDWFNATYYKNSPPVDPMGPIEGDDRVLRGGSWSGFDGNVRSAYRDKFDPLKADPYIGFRCASGTTP